METIVKKLNVFLSDLNVFFRKLQNYHWYIEGKDFFILHAKLQEYYEDIFKQIDEVAEHILIIGYEPLATMKDYLENTGLIEAENKKVKCEEVFSVLVNDFEYLLKSAKEIRKIAEEKEFSGTSTFMDNMIEDYSKKIWMIKQMMS